MDKLAEYSWIYCNTDKGEDISTEELRNLLNAETGKNFEFGEKKKWMFSVITPHKENLETAVKELAKYIKSGIEDNYCPDFKEGIFKVIKVPEEFEWVRRMGHNFSYEVLADARNNN